jgi:hypothetical protein
MFSLLMLGSGVLWTLTYLLIIRRSILDHTYGMPLVALCANISWEFLFSFVYYPSDLTQRIIFLTWFYIDVLMLCQLLYYGPREFADLPKQAFYTIMALALPTTFCAMLLFTMQFRGSATYSAFGINLLMSVLFIAMLYHRRSLRGQSIPIAVCKLLGTALISSACYFYVSPSVGYQSSILVFLYISTFVCDTIYVGLLVYMQQRERETYKLKSLRTVYNNGASASLAHLQQAPQFVDHRNLLPQLGTQTDPNGVSNAFGE